MNDTAKRSSSRLLPLLHAAHAAEAAVEAELSTVGLSFAKALALKALADADHPLPLSQLAERLSCVRSNVTQLVDRLEADGLVVRQGDPRDRRARLAALTAAGRKAHLDATRVQQQVERRVLSTLTKEESALLMALLTKFEQ